MNQSITWTDFRNREELTAILEENRPFRCFYAYFDMENHWLLPYPVDFYHSPYGILESYNGSVFGIENVNCGYNGTGPGNTVGLLTMLGVSETQAQDWIRYSGISVFFDEQGKPVQKTMGSVFESRKASDPNILLSDFVRSSKTNKILYFINPQENHFDSLFAAIRFCEPQTYTAYCGGYADRYIDYSEIFSASISTRDHRKYSDLTKGGFIRVAGAAFTIVIMINHSCVISVIQHVYQLLFSRQYFYEHKVGQLTVFSQKQFGAGFFGKLGILASLFRKPVEISPQTENIPPLDKRRDVFSL